MRIIPSGRRGVIMNYACHTIGAEFNRTSENTDFLGPGPGPCPHPAIPRGFRNDSTSPVICPGPSWHVRTKISKRFPRMFYATDR